MKSQKRLSRYSLFVLAYNVFVILFGAYVRASGSGAGCGQHWPLCNGDIVPLNPRFETIIEFTHRITSGLSLVFILILFIWVFRSNKAGSRIRKAAGFALGFVIIEAIVGAGLVMFQLVEGNDSAARAAVIAIHLINTYLLLGSILLVYLWSRKDGHINFSLIPYSRIIIIIVTLTLLLLGSSGAITALGDTLFPAGSLSEGMAQDLNGSAHFLIQLRIYHPMIAVGLGFLIFGFVRYSRKFITTSNGMRFSNFLLAGFIIQIFIGTLNVLLLAPIWMQVIHLFTADSIWLLYVLYINEILSDYSQLSLQQN